MKIMINEMIMKWNNEKWRKWNENEMMKMNENENNDNEIIMKKIMW